MPTIDLQKLIKRLEDIDQRLSFIWNDSQNYTTLEELELVRNKLRGLIEALEQMPKPRLRIKIPI